MTNNGTIWSHWNFCSRVIRRRENTEKERKKERKKERAKRKREEIKGKKCLVSTDRENVHWKEGVMIKKIIIHPTYVSTM